MRNIFAIAHIRGGADLGKPWHEDGRMLTKKNSFTDFIACAEHLIAQQYTSRDRLGIKPLYSSETADGWRCASETHLLRSRKRPELGFVFANFDDRVPQIEYDVDRDKVKSLGIPLSDVFFTLQTFLGGYYVNDFNLFGRTFRVQAQAVAAAQGANPDPNVLPANWSAIADQYTNTYMQWLTQTDASYWDPKLSGPVMNAATGAVQTSKGLVDASGAPIAS